MRTTLEIDDDVLQAARELAAKDGTSLGAIVSRLARNGLRSGPGNPVSSPTRRSRTRNGIPTLPRRGDVITLQHVLKLGEAERA